MNRIATKIKEARLKAGLTEKELAKKCGLTAGYIIQVESGRKIINEKASDKILSALGTKAEMLEETSMREEKANSEKKPVKKAAPVSYTVEPNAQWASALAGVLKKYPIYDCASGKVMGNKELPIINKKVEGHNPDRLMFIQLSNDELEVLRLLKGDVLTVLQTKEIQNDNMYLVEVSKKKMVRKVRFENNKMRLSTGVKGKDILLDKKDVDIHGKCLKVEFTL
jgi:transcriptional regulator with XRE-family HTH domain